MLSALQAHRQFVVWKLVPNPAGGKPLKVPINFQTGFNCDAHDAVNWTDFNTATQMVPLVSGTGVGFILTPLDPIGCIDLDACLQADGAWSPFAVQMVEWFPDAAIELSYSGNGLHLWFQYDLAQLPPNHRTRSAKVSGLEVYTARRFMALGSKVYRGSAASDGTVALLHTLNTYLPGGAATQATDWTDEAVPEWNGPTDDEELLAKMLGSKKSAASAFGGKASFTDLWQGNVEALARTYPSDTGDDFNHSSADAALMSHLAFWTGKNCVRMDRLFRRSALIRAKYVDRPYYQQKTITEACGWTTDVYSAPVKTTLLTQTLPLYSLASFADCEPPELIWQVEGFFPVGFVTLCAGPGGTGKSLLGVQLQIGAAAKIQFFNILTRFGRTLGFYGEEDLGELERRTKRICEGMDVHRGAIQDAYTVPMHGLDAVLAVWDGTKMVPTEIYQQFESLIASLEPQCVIIDNIARVFSGDENNRMHASQFVALLEAWAVKFECAVILMGHPAKAEGSEYSGNTAWESSVRSRVFFGIPETDGEDKHLTTDQRVLRVGKANLARKGTQIEMHYLNGCFHRTGSENPLVRAAEDANRESRVDQAFLDCLDALQIQNRSVSEGKSSTKYAPKMMMEMPESAGFNKRELERAMNRLFSNGKIKANQTVGRYDNRNPIKGIARVEECTNPPAQSPHIPAQNLPVTN